MIEAGIASFIGRGSIRRGEAVRLVTAMGFKAGILNKWEENGMLTSVKSGTMNSPITYERTQLYAAIEAAKIKRDNIIKSTKK